MGEKKICVYTCITGSYDDLQPVEKEKVLIIFVLQIIKG